MDIPAIDYVIQGDREYCRLQQELNEANERNDGHAIARIHGQLETLDAWTIQSRAASLLHGLGFNQEEISSTSEILLWWLANALEFGTSIALSIGFIITG